MGYGYFEMGEKMIINKITLNNFKNFTDQSFSFDKMNLIKGENGTGKSTLALESILFALYGYTPKDTLAKLANRKTNKKSYSVSVELASKGRSYTINRSYPTKLEVLAEGQIGRAHV